MVIGGGEDVDVAEERVWSPPDGGDKGGEGGGGGGRRRRGKGDDGDELHRSGVDDGD